MMESALKAADIMTSKVVSVRPEASLEEAVQSMIQNRVSGLPVVDQEALVVGIVTEGDLLRRAETSTERQRSRWLRLLISSGRLAQDYVRENARKISELMTTNVISVDQEAPLSEVVALMESRRIKRLLVLAQGRLVGIISRADVLRALAKSLPGNQSVAVSDAELRTRVLDEIDKQPWAPHVDAKVENGNVELRGVIHDLRERQALSVLVENMPGVKGVQDYLVWIDPGSGVALDLPKATEAE
jgi:CBS domain-containing protein